MRSIRPLFTSRAAGPRRGARAVAALAATSALVLTATACGPEDDQSGPSTPSATADPAGGGLPDDWKERLKDRGIDVDKWKDGEWKNWDKDKWLREAQDFINPIIEGLWDPDRAGNAKPPREGVDDNDISGDQGVNDPLPERVEATEVAAPVQKNAAASGKLLFDTPKGQAVCSATVVKDPANPGKSNMLWTAGHCVHAGVAGGWYRNLAFAPAYNDKQLSRAELENATEKDVFPHGIWWSDGAAISSEWRDTGGGENAAVGAQYDFAVLHMRPEKSSGGKSLEELIGAVEVDFDAPAVPKISEMTATGYPAAPPFDGSKAFQCVDKPARLSPNPDQPTMYTVGCSMTAGSSGGGWTIQGEDGKPHLVSNTSIGPVTSGWLAGPRLDAEAKKVFTGLSDKAAGKS